MLIHITSKNIINHVVIWILLIVHLQFTTLTKVLYPEKLACLVILRMS